MTRICTSAVLIVMSAGQSCFAGEFDPFKGPKPIVVLIQTDPWAMVIGSDTPLIAIYENGEVIFAKKVDRRVSYRRAMLDKVGIERVRAQIRPVLAIQNLKPSYELTPYVTDQPDAKFFISDDKRTLATSVYGLRTDGTWRKRRGEPTSKPSEPTLPGALLQLHKWLREFDSPKSTEWVPKYIEVMLWDYSYAPEESITWPKDWPSLGSERSFVRGDAFSIFLDGYILNKLRDFLASRNERGAVEVDGKKMSVSYRFAFPSEPIWRRAFVASDEKANETHD